MSHEFIIRLSNNEEIPSPSYMENILKPLPGYFGKVEYPNDLAYEFRSETNQNTENIPDLYVTYRRQNIVIASNNSNYLQNVMATLVIAFVTESKGERIEVFRP